MITRSKAKTQALFDEVGWNRNVDHIKKLISQGANVNAEDNFTNTPLHMTLKVLASSTFYELESELADSGSSGKYAGESDVWKIIETRIRRAADVVDLLLRHGANASARNKGDVTPLHLATRVGNISEILTYLPLRWRNNEWKEQIENSLSEAADQTAIRIVELLLSEGADVDAEDLDESLESDIVVTYDLREVGWSAHLEAELYLGRTPLHTAVYFGSTSVVELLLERQANVNARDDLEDTPLHTAVENRSTHLVELLLKYGADVNHINDNGETPLQESVRLSLTSIAELLLKSGADPNARNDEDETPLFEALRHGERSILKLLLEHGADINFETTNSSRTWTPLNYAASWLSPEMVIFLLEHGAKVNPDSPYMETPLQCAMDSHLPTNAKLLLEHGADVNARNDEDRTPLHLLFGTRCLRTFKDMLDLLLEYGADLEARDEYGRTPAFCIEDSMDLFTQKPKQLLAAINEVFARGAFVNAIDYFGQTIYWRLTQAAKIKGDQFKKSVFLNHMRKLIALGAIFMAERNQPLFFDIVDPFKEDCTILQPMQQTNPLEGEEDDLYESCLDELDILETIQIFPNITLADVLTLGNPVTVASISNNNVFQQYAQSIDLHSNFPNYAFVISHQYQRGLQMKLLCEKCEVSLGIVSSGKLHRYCAYEVLKYLSEVDLKNLAEAGN